MLKCEKFLKNISTNCKAILKIEIVLHDTGCVLEFIAKLSLAYLCLPRHLPESEKNKYIIIS